MAAYVDEAYGCAGDIAQAAQDLKQRLRRKGVYVSFPGFEARLGRCRWPFSSLFISVEGHVTPCCIRMHREHALGNIFEVASLEEIWNGPDYRALRQAHLDGDTSNPMCGRCPR